MNYIIEFDGDGKLDEYIRPDDIENAIEDFLMNQFGIDVTVSVEVLPTIS